MAEDVVQSIRGNITKVVDMIPEIKKMINFPHNHPHHHLDVWEHTLLAMSNSPQDFDIRLTLLLHDIGKPISYQDEEVRHFREHPKMSRYLGEKILTRVGYDNSDYILKLIGSHDTPIESDKIITDPEYYRDLLVVQYCDAMAHNPKYNAKRIAYIESMAREFDRVSKECNITMALPNNLLRTAGLLDKEM